MLYNKLPEKDIEMIEDYINTYAGEIIHNPASLEYRLRYWNENKQDLFNAFNGNFILEREVEYEKPVDNIIDDFIDNYIDEDITNFYIEMRNIAITLYPDYLRNWDFYNRYNSIMSYDAICRGIYYGESFDIPLPHGKKFRVLEGTKISRVYYKISKAYNIDGWEHLMDVMSTLLTNRRVQGTLCLSIHPLDYITMSDNEEGWESCMNWGYSDGGESGSYRCGTIEMMNSPYMVVAYLRSKNNNIKWNNYEWNSKVWRELFIVSDDIISNVRAYPFQDNYLSKISAAWLYELIHKIKPQIPYRNKLLSWNNSDESQDSDFIRENRVSFDIWTGKMYNDYTRNECFGYINEQTLKINSNTISLCISGPLTCMICGESMGTSDMENESFVGCYNCIESHSVKCFHCEDRMGEDDIYWIDGQPFCQYCYNEYCVKCVDDEWECHYNNNCTPYYLSVNNSIKWGYCVWFYNTANVPNYLNEDAIQYRLGVNIIDVNEVDPDFLRDYFEYRR